MSLSALTAQDQTQSKTIPVENLADGVYGYCDLPETAPREMFAMCFSFRKTGKRIVGLYYPDRSDFEEICLEGTVNGNTVNGFALESVEGQPLSEHLPTSGGKTLVNWDQLGHLKVAGKKVVVNTPNEFVTGWVRFDSAVLNLNGFSRWNSTNDRVPNRCTIDEINNVFK